MIGMGLFNYILLLKMIIITENYDIHFLAGMDYVRFTS